MTDQQPGIDPAFLAFLHARLDEERAAAVARAEQAAAVPQERTERAMRLLEEILDRLEAGGVPDRMSRDLLVVAYAEHPAFRPEWNRWRQAARPR